jgi:hypothetical protein
MSTCTEMNVNGLIQRYNDDENQEKYVDDPTMIRYVSGKTSVDLSEKVSVGSKLYLLGSRKLRKRGFIGRYRILKIKRKECALTDKELKPFTKRSKRHRRGYQYRIKVECEQLYKQNFLHVSNSESLCMVFGVQNITVIDAETIQCIDNVLKDVLEDHVK